MYSLMLFGILPDWLIANIGAFSLIALGYLVEKEYVGRMSIFASGIALNINYLPFAKTLPQWLGFYLDGAFLMAAIGILSYASRNSMPKWFYQIGWLYSSLTAGLVVLIIRL